MTITKKQFSYGNQALPPFASYFQLDNIILNYQFLSSLLFTFNIDRRSAFIFKLIDFGFFYHTTCF